MEHKGANPSVWRSGLAAVQITETYAAECKSPRLNLDCENRNKFSYVIYSPRMGKG